MNKWPEFEDRDDRALVESGASLAHLTADEYAQARRAIEESGEMIDFIEAVANRPCDAEGACEDPDDEGPPCDTHKARALLRRVREGR